MLVKNEKIIFICLLEYFCIFIIVKTKVKINYYCILYKNNEKINYL